MCIRDSDRTLNVGAGNGIHVDADSISVKSNTTGSPGTIGKTVTNADGVGAVSYTHLIRSLDRKPVLFFETANTTTQALTGESVYATAKGVKRIAFAPLVRMKAEIIVC